ncbi:MAG: hypothetical protein B7Y42_00370 [Polaromonas sp. 28-63-22]|jgi:hypothetical protein|nr:MAG: hypothetical protein B7Y42_00370 [Polaromonas sp. 28-63-22]
MQQITPAQVLSALEHHQGKARGIHVRDLVMRITGELANGEGQERAVRKLVTELRLEGHPICAHPASGYFLAETAEELDDTCNFLRSRALSSLKAESRLRRISMAELLGQFSLTESNPGEGAT